MTRTSKWSRIAVLFAVLALAGWVSAEELATSQQASTFKRTGPIQATRGYTPEQYFARQSSLHDWLVQETPIAALANPLTIRLTGAELAEMNEQPEGNGPTRVGIVRKLSPSVPVSCRAVGRNGDDFRCTGGGTLELTEDGGFIWARSIGSEGATGIRLHVIGMNLPADADMYFYGTNGEAYGPFQGAGPNGDGDFWLPSVMTDTGTVVVRHFGPDGKADLPSFSVTLADIGHIGPGFNDDPIFGTESFCSYNASCIQNNSCTSDPAVNDAEGAVAKMLWVAGCCINICTGGLIADSAGTQTPYFLTANHCISKGNAANNLEAFFQYTASCGTSSCAGTFTAPPGAPKTTGSSIVVTGRTGDFTLLQLNQNPPAGSTFLGWNNTPIAFNAGAALHRISHPSGAPQAYSEHAVNTTSSTCLSTARGDWIYSDDVTGATEGGSSGSPVVNSAGEVVGQLTGCCGSNCGNVCASSSNRTIDGALAGYWNAVAPYLDNGSCTPSPEVCDNGTDDDCDGAVDCNDADCSGNPACSGGGCTLGQPGDSCSSDSECCSNKCKGPPGGQTCR